MQTDCGYTPAQIREMTLIDVNRLFSHWAKFPPVRDLVAAFVGFEIPTEPTEERSKEYMTADKFKQLMAATGGRVPGLS